jgi:DNA-binding CsgD family transcriptional regulator
MLAGVRAGDGSPPEARLLLVRALLRVHRPQDVSTVLSEADAALMTDADECTTARMLLAAVVARSDQTRGIALLARLAESVSPRTHPSILAEIAYYRALAHWKESPRNLDAAEDFVREAERLGRDVLAVRATVLRAFIAAARPSPARYANALALFRAAYRAYGSCRHHDTYVATTIIEQTAALEQTLRSASITGTHSGPHGRSLPGTSFGPAVRSEHRTRLLINDAWLFALDGSYSTAFSKLDEAQGSAQAAPFEFWVRASRAALSAYCGEYANAKAFADSARHIAATVRWDANPHDIPFGYLHLAEVYACLDDAAGAGAALAAFYNVSKSIRNIDSIRNLEDDPRLTGWISAVSGLTFRAAGRYEEAVSAFDNAAETFRSCGYLWREALTLIEISATPAAGQRHESPLDAATVLIRDHFPHSFLSRLLAPWAKVRVDPIVSSLSSAERAILWHLLDGRTQKDIASITGRKYNTIRTQMASIHKKLGTHTEHQIVIACAERGIGRPTWSLTHQLRN